MAEKRNRILPWLALLVLLATLGYLGWWWIQNRFEVKGIDVSHYQGEIDWAAVAHDGIAFAFIKATEGTTVVDERFATNWAGAGKADVARGAYHFFRPTLSGADQARHFLSHVTYRPGDMPPVLDLEVTDDATAAVIRREALAWCKAVEDAWGVKPIVYTLPHYADSYLDGALSPYRLWVVDLGLRLWPADSKGWQRWTFWQHSHHGSVAGIEGDVDLDVFNGSEADFQHFLEE